MAIHSVETRLSLTRAGRFAQPQSAAGLGLLFDSVVTSGEESRARVEAERAGAQVDVALRVGYLDAGLAEEARDPVVDVALDGGVAARPVRPDEEAELEVV